MTRLDRVRKLHDAIVAGDIDQVMTDAMDEIEWRNPAEAIEPGTRRGQPEFAEALHKLFEQFDFEQLEILEWSPDPDAALRSVGLDRWPRP